MSPGWADPTRYDETARSTHARLNTGDKMKVIYTTIHIGMAQAYCDARPKANLIIEEWFGKYNVLDAG